MIQPKRAERELALQRTPRVFFSDMRSVVTLLGVFAMAACAVPPLESTQRDTELARYANAMDRHQPLGLVKGDNRGSILATSGDYTARLGEAIRYAERTNSYALLVWHDGALRLERYFADYDEDLRPESASMHKTVLGLAVLAAISDGYIDSVDEPASLHLPEWRGDERNRITVRDLLTMTSGLEALSMDGGDKSARRRFFSDGATSRSTILSLKLVDEPGTTFRYANTDSQLLGLLLENAVGRPYEAYLSTRLWQRLGAADAYVWYNEAARFPRTYTALLARARDWLRVGLLLKDYGNFDGSQLLPRELVHSMTSPSASNRRYGWQVWLGTDEFGDRFYNTERTGLSVAQSEPFAQSDLVFLDGFGGQRVYISRKHDLVIVRLGDAQLDWDDAVLPNRIAESLDR